MKPTHTPPVWYLGSQIARGKIWRSLTGERLLHHHLRYICDKKLSKLFVSEPRTWANFLRISWKTTWEVKRTFFLPELFARAFYKKYYVDCNQIGGLRRKCTRLSVQLDFTVGWHHGCGHKLHTSEWEVWGFCVGLVGYRYSTLLFSSPKIIN
jgi:hypothetical protein